MLKKAAMFQSKDQTWTTPKWLYKQICESLGIDNFDTDPATNENNPLGCKTYYTERENGLENDWNGKCWINPPFGYCYHKGKRTHNIGLWIKEAWERTQTDKDPDVTLVVMLIPARTDTKSFHHYIYKQKNVDIEFLEGRIKFGIGNNPAPFPSMLVYFHRRS